MVEIERSTGTPAANVVTLGIVVIGRNEGARLVTCLKSAVAQSRLVVYVDSGSTDDSIARAEALGVEVVFLDPNVPFTAARARNLGLAHLLNHDSVEYVQFVDGDCELDPDWCQQALSFLETRLDVAVVCGRRAERAPQNSVFNLLCDLEWDTPIGEASACGGDALMRTAALRQVGGYNPDLIAGEEPELCLRLRQQGRRIFRLDAKMTLHDAQITAPGQWWQRAVRGGHAYAEVSWLHRHETEKFWMRESVRIWVWGLALPTIILILIPITHGWSLALSFAYVLLMVKLYIQNRRYGARAAFVYAVFCTLIKFPELQGQIKFHRNRLLGSRSRLIEYKASPHH